MRVLITGASQGIGRSIALSLAERGATLALCASRSAVALKEVAHEVEQLGGKAICALGDLASPDIPAKLVGQATAAFGGLDAVVANAAASAHGPLEHQEVRAWDRVYAINVRSTWLLGQAALTHLSTSRGCFLAIGSISGSSPHPGTGAYSSSKSAVEMLIRQMAVEWGPLGVRANLLSPGFTLTPRTSAIYEDEQMARERVEMVPLRKLGDPRCDIARAAMFLLSPESSYINGHNLVVDGGVVNSLFSYDPAARESLRRRGPGPTGLARPPRASESG